MEVNLYRISLKFQQDFLKYIQNEFIPLNIPVLLQNSSSISLPYLIVALSVLQQFFRGKGWFLMEIHLLQPHYSVELEEFITQWLYKRIPEPIILMHFHNILLGKTITRLDVPTRCYKEGKQAHSTLWKLSVMSRWTTDDQ